jgi:transcriptional regulator with XRE-family HTH domain
MPRPCGVQPDNRHATRSSELTSNGDQSNEGNWYSDETATFGDRLAGAREAAGLTQKDLAARLGVKLKTVRDWENDVNDPRANKLQMLSGVLNVTITWLLTGQGEGVEAPRTDDATAGAIEVLDEMRDIRREISELTTRLTVLESRLRAALRA